jgi:hypothetical protein
VTRHGANIVRATGRLPSGVQLVRYVVGHDRNVVRSCQARDRTIQLAIGDRHAESTRDGWQHASDKRLVQIGQAGDEIMQ